MPDLLDEGNERCFLHDLSVSLELVDCPASLGRHRRHTEDGRCRKQRCKGHSRKDILDYILKNNMEKKLMLDSVMGDFLSYYEGL